MSWSNPTSWNNTSSRYLTRLMSSVEPREVRSLPYLTSKYDGDQWKRNRMRIDCDEVYPGIVVGNGETMKNVKYLERMGITHVLNCEAQEVRIDPQLFYKNGFAYMAFRCKDLPNDSEIVARLGPALSFIERALSFEGGKVFVGCLWGKSISSTVVSAFLMKKKGLSAGEALTTQRKERDVKPNPGFLHQLGQLDDVLRRQRHRKH